MIIVKSLIQPVAFLLAAAITAITGCSYDYDDQLDNSTEEAIEQSEKSPNGKVSSGQSHETKFSWREVALAKRSDDPVIEIGQSTESGSSGQSSCPKRTLCLRAPYLGTTQFTRLSDLNKDLFELKTEEGRAIISMTGKSAQEVEKMVLEADTLELDRSVNLKTDGRPIVIVASEILGPRPVGWTTRLTRLGEDRSSPC